MPLFNYTTEVPAEKSIAELKNVLIKHGAKKILTDYDDDQNTVAMSFMIETEAGLTAYRLPLEWERVLQVLRSQKVQPRYQTKEQAIRVGWRILKDWTKAQLAIIETRMVSLDQVFLPYAIVRGDQTLYEYVKNDTTLLSAPKND